MAPSYHFVTFTQVCILHTARDYVTMSESLRKFNSKGHRATHCHSGFDPASLERSSGPLELENYVGSLRYH